MRVTTRAITMTSLAGLNRNQDAVGKLQQQLTSGKAVTKPSDSPTDTNAAMRLRNDLRAAEQQSRNIGDGTSLLDRTDTALQKMIELTRTVRDRTVQAMNTGATSASAQAAIKAEVTSIREEMLAIANTTVAGRPLFGGVTGAKVAYDTTGAYIGTSGTPVTRRVSDTEALRVDITGPEAFGDPTGPLGDLFAMVDKIATDVADPTALATHLGNLDTLYDGMLTATADVGARAARLEQADALNKDRLVALKKDITGVEDIDLTQTIVELEMRKVGYQAALAATAKAIQPSLLDFLR